MRHKYETRGIVLSRSPVGEASVFIGVLTPELGLVRALAQSVRKSGAKLSAALATFAESDLVLVRGRDGWRLAGAVLREGWFSRLRNTGARERAGRVSGLLLRLVVGETSNPALFSILTGFFEALATLPQELHEPAETLAVVRILAALGLDTGNVPGALSEYTPSILATIVNDRADYIARINRGIAASEL